MFALRVSNFSFLRVNKLLVCFVVFVTLFFWWISTNFLLNDTISLRKYFGYKKIDEIWFFQKSQFNIYQQSDNKTQLFSDSPLDVEVEYAKLTCKFARLDPWDPTILAKIYHPRGISCEQRQENFTYLDYNGTLNLNITALQLYRKANSLNDPLNCSYETFDRDDGENDRNMKTVTIGPLYPYTPVKLDTDMVKVTCFDQNGTEIYFNIHAHPCLTCKNKTFTPWTPGNLSVLMLALDSTSTSVLKRHLTKTYDYIKNVMKFKIFNGHSKVGDNSFPNMIAALTGLRYQYEQRDMPPDTNEDIYKIQFDHWPLAWKFFEKKGYATSFNEDKAEWGLFHYLARGFKRKPVDFFYHSYWYSIYLREHYSKIADTYCFRNSPKVERLLDVARRHLVKMGDVLQFHYTFLTDLCHEFEGSEEERADDFVYYFFKSMHENGHFNRTVVLFFSDHGHRYTPIRSTLVGLLEERTPMFNVWFPSWFYAKYPHIEKNLDINTVRLSSSFDIYQTLIDLADSNFEGQQRPYGSRGYSQLYPIPTNRTCFEAGVPDHHCTCVSMTPLQPHDGRIAKFAGHFLKYVNNILAPFSNICSNFTLKRVLRAEQLNVNEKLALGVKNYQKETETVTPAINLNATVNTNFTETPPTTEHPKLKPMNKVRVAIEVEPMGAQLEAVVEYSDDNGTYAVTSDVSRLNPYGSQSACVTKKLLQKLCVCHTFLQSLNKQR